MGERLVDDALEQIGRLFKENVELRTELARVKLLLNARIATESADAAAGSYAGRAEEAEARAERAEARAQYLDEEALRLQRTIDEARKQRDDWHDEATRQRTRAERAEAALKQARQQNADLIVAWKQGNARRDRLDGLNSGLQRSALEDALEQRTRAEQAEQRAAKAEAALAELRERLGEPKAEYGLRYGKLDPLPIGDGEVTFYLDQGHVGLVERDVWRGGWRPAGAAPRTILERAADEQGVQPVRDVAELGAGEKPTAAEFEAFDAARREGGGDE